MEGMSLWFQHSHLWTPRKETVHQYLTARAAKEQGRGWEGARQRGREMQGVK